MYSWFSLWRRYERGAYSRCTKLLSQRHGLKWCNDTRLFTWQHQVDTVVLPLSTFFIYGKIGHLVYTSQGSNKATGHHTVWPDGNLFIYTPTTVQSGLFLSNTYVRSKLSTFTISTNLCTGECTSWSTPSGGSNINLITVLILGIDVQITLLVVNFIWGTRIYYNLSKVCKLRKLLCEFVCNMLTLVNRGRIDPRNYTILVWYTLREMRNGFYQLPYSVAIEPFRLYHSVQFSALGKAPVHDGYEYTMSTRQILTLNNLISIALNPFLEPISTKQCLISLLFKETTRGCDGVRAHDCPSTSQTYHEVNTKSIHQMILYGH